MKDVDSLYTFVCLVLAVSLVGTPATGAELVINGDFESDVEDFVVWPGYVGGANDAGDVNPDEVPDWIGDGGRGINPVHAPANPPEITAWPGTGGRGINPIAADHETPAPFRDNGDNETTVAFLQGAASIGQTVTGLNVGENYTLNFDFNARDCCGDFPIGELSLNGDAVDLPDLSDTVFPVTGLEPWYSASHDFTADSTELSVELFSMPEAGGDATLIVDNFELLAEGGDENLLVNGDFEMDADNFDVWPGYVGGGQGQAPFRDNGDNDTSVAFLQGTAGLEQTIQGLTVGEEYVLSLDFNARNCCGGEVPVAEMLIDGEFVDDFPGEAFDGGVVEPVGGDEPWYRYETTIVAEEETLDLRIQTFPLAGGDSTLVIDNVSLATPAAPGDFDGDGQLTATDIDLLNEEIRFGTNLADFDLNGDRLVNAEDRSIWVEDLKNTYFGDANLDGEFNSADFVFVFSRGEYEDSEPLNSTWEDGDWNGDAEFNSSDFVTAFTGGGYESGPRAAVSAVPEPTTASLLLVAGLALLLRNRPGLPSRT